MRLLITGATGILGHKLCPSLLTAGYQLRLLVRKQSAKDSLNTESVIGDLSDRASLQRAAQGIDTVVHLAGLTHTNQENLYFKINTEGTKNLLAACQANGIKRFIFISSRTASQHGGAYAQSKLEAEQAIQQSNLNWLILRIAETYGPGMSGGGVAQLIKLVQKSPVVPIIGTGNYGLSPVYIDDVINCIVTAVAKSDLQQKLYLVAGPKKITYNELVDEIAGLHSRKVFKLHIPVWLAKLMIGFAALLGKDYLAKDQIPRLLSSKPTDISEVIKDLNFQPRDLAAGLDYLKK